MCVSFLFSQEVSNNREWINMLYYEKSGSYYTSLAEDSCFFVSDEGRTNPQKEYEESLKLVRTQDSNFKQKFPLRYKYIAKQNGIDYLPEVIILDNIKKAKVVFPNRYMNNPASMFGHIFLVLETDKGLLDSDIFHFIAETDSDSGVSYLVKGLTGKYKGWFLREPYYKKIKEYNYVEDRDVIYYDLMLDEEQIENLQLHYIELQNTFFYYYFLDKNCAFFIGKFLNVVLENNVVPNSLYVLPTQIINNLYDLKLLGDERIRVASTKIFNDMFNKLNNQQKEEVVKLFYFKNDEINASIESLKTFLVISEYLISNQSHLSDIIRYNRIAAYKIIKVNIRQPEIVKDVSKIKSKSISISYMFNKYYEFSFNPLYYSEYEDLNKNEIIRTKCLESQIKISTSNVFSYNVKILDFKNIIQSNAIINAFSWEFNSSLLFQDAFYINNAGYYGLASSVVNNGIIYGLLGLTYSNFDDILEERMNELFLFPAIQVGLNHSIWENWKLAIIYENKYRRDYLNTTLIYKNGDFLYKFMTIATKDKTIFKLLGEYSF